VPVRKQRRRTRWHAQAHPFSQRVSHQRSCCLAAHVCDDCQLCRYDWLSMRHLLALRFQNVSQHAEQMGSHGWRVACSGRCRPFSPFWLHRIACARGSSCCLCAMAMRVSRSSACVCARAGVLRLCGLRRGERSVRDRVDVRRVPEDDCGRACERSQRRRQRHRQCALSTQRGG